MRCDILRPLTPTQSLETSLQQMKLIREGKLPRKSWDEIYNELKEERRQFIRNQTNRICDRNDNALRRLSKRK